MTTSIKLKKSSVSGRVPSPGDLDYGELAINYADGILYFKNSTNVVGSISGNSIGVDSAATIAIIDSAYVQARQSAIGVDSAATINLVDSAYVQARTTAGTDSATVISLIDSAYVQARTAAGGNDSATTIALTALRPAYIAPFDWLPLAVTHASLTVGRAPYVLAGKSALLK